MSRPLHFAVVVGINRYPAISPLQHARTDAQRFSDWLRKKDGGGLPGGNVALIAVDDAEEDGKSRADALPVSKQVWDALDPFRDAMDLALDEDPDNFADSRLYFFVSGHGISAASGDASLLMADASPDHYGNNVSCREIIKFFDLRQYFAELVVFADCCRQPDGECTPGGPPWGRKARNFGGVRKLWGFATQFQDVALEPTAVIDGPPDDDERHGYFTQALLEKLEDPSGHTVDGHTLRNYVVQRVVELTNGRQRPEMPIDDNIVFRDGTANAGYKIRIHFPIGFTGPVQLCRGLSEVIDEHTAKDGPWTVTLPDDLYRVRPVGADEPQFGNHGAFAVEGSDRHVRL